MILPDFVLTTRVGLQCNETGIDSLHEVVNKQHFLNYPHTISYNYNSRGFRDIEWPDSQQELASCIFCIGDSFTVGLGSSVDHMWSNVLAQQAGIRIINVSLDGASNTWIARKAQRVLQEISPIAIICAWTYFHRRELDDTCMTDEDRRVHMIASTFEEDLTNFISCVTPIAHTHTKVLNFLIPDAQCTSDNLIAWQNFSGHSWPALPPNCTEEFLKLPQSIQDEITLLDKNKRFMSNLAKNDLTLNSIKKLNVIQIPQLDYSRDGHHFDLKTSDWIAKESLRHILDSVSAC